MKDLVVCHLLQRKLEELCEIEQTLLEEGVKVNYLAGKQKVRASKMKLLSFVPFVCLILMVGYVRGDACSLQRVNAAKL